MCVCCIYMCICTDMVFIFLRYADVLYRVDTKRQDVEGLDRKNTFVSQSPPTKNKSIQMKRVLESMTVCVCACVCVCKCVFLIWKSKRIAVMR